MILVAIFLINAALSFALSLILAAVLGPDGFGRFAIGLAVTLAVNTCLFEWLRLSTTRFYSERVRAAEPAIRRTLDRAYLLMGGALCGLTACALVLPVDYGVSHSLLAAASACGLAYGFCEYRMALARARFLERSYAALGLLRALFGFVFSAGAAYATGNPAWVLAGAALSAFCDPVRAPDAARRGSARDRATPGPPARLLALCPPPGRRERAVPVHAAPHRTLLAGRDGFTEAGYFSLASELVTRLFQNLGAALDLVLFQLAVRAEELHGREAADRQVAQNAAAVGAIVIAAAAGLWTVWPAFEAVFIPRAFQGRLEGTMRLMIPTLAAFALVQYALNAVFQLRHRTAPVVAAALAALAVDLAVVMFWPGLAGREGFAAAQLAGMSVGLLLLAAIAVRSGARLPWRDLARAALAAALMAAILWPTRGWGPPGLALALQAGLGALIYGTLAVAFDVAGSRRPVMARLRSFRRVPGSSTVS